jgi:conserved oligomeric Golgi complex subunit 4
MSGSKATDKVTVRMNYNLDEEAFHLSQLSEGYVSRLCTLLDELLDPLRTYLTPRLWDSLWLMVMNTVCKRLETSLRKCEFSSLGALALDSDLRDLWNYTKDRLVGTEYSSYAALGRGCHALHRLLQVAKLLNVDDLEDVLDLITSHKRKSNWDLKLEETKAFLSQRVEFETSRVNELLRLPDED